VIVTLDQAKAHLRVAGTDEDAAITLYVGAAEESAAQYVNRALYADQTTLDAAVAAYAAAVTADPAAVAAPPATDDGTGMVATDAVRAAILLIVGHLYANRENVITGMRAAAVQVPQSSQWLLDPYRINQGMC